ncbi:MAG TPA: tautomerase family protein [Ktedonobacteraceae bacterium]|nr:tautomerase family protein [Ktedonobacteraceae bacterium]
MPLVHIDLREGQSAEYKKAISNAVQSALIEHLNVPERDCFQLIREHTPEHFIYNPDYLDIQRTDATVMIQVTLSAGRSVEQKRQFYARLVELLQDNPGIRAQDVIICLVENTRENWSFGNGEAQYLALPKELWK